MWGAAIDKVPHLRRLSNLDEGDWVAILSTDPGTRSEHVMFYNKNTGEHRWKEQSDAVTLQIISDSKRGIEEDTWLYRHMLSSSCEQARAYDHYPVQVDGRGARRAPRWRTLFHSRLPISFPMGRIGSRC